MVKYPKEAYAPSMEVYKSVPEELKDKANNIIRKYSKYAEGEAPPYEMARRLLPLAPTDQQNRLEEMIRSAEEKSRQKQAIAVSSGIASFLESIGNSFSNPYLATASVAAALMLFYV